MHWLQNSQKRTVLFQLCALLTVFLIGFYLFHNAKTNLQEQNIASGFGFLKQEAGFAINQTLIKYSSENSYGRAILVGLFNTIIVAIPGVLFAILLGTMIGIGRLSNHWLLKKVTACYVELFRNIPVLLQLFFWYALITEVLPKVRNAISPFEHVYLSNKGFIVPALYFQASFQAAVLAIVISSGCWFILRQQKQICQKLSSQRLYSLLQILSLTLVPCIILFIANASLTIEFPERTRFGFNGGFNLSPEYLAVFLGLTLYTAAFVAEIVRSGIDSVAKGQKEAAASLGLNQTQILKLVVLPQALRVIIPPLTNQMLNLTKNSSLAVAIGYPDLVNITQTTMNQTGQAIEAITILISIYLALSLLTSLFMNWYNHQVKLTEK